MTALPPIFGKQTGGLGVVLSDTGAAYPTFKAPDVGMGGSALMFELTVTDNHGLQAKDNCIVNATWVNVPPVANAGPDQIVDERTPVTLDGSASFDPDDGIAGYQWTPLSGPPVGLSDSTAQKPTFLTPDVGYDGAVVTFELTVTDRGGLKASAQCSVTVLWVNTRPSQADLTEEQRRELLEEAHNCFVHRSLKHEPEISLNLRIV